MRSPQSPDNEQNKLWNSSAASGWVASAALIDKLLQPFEDLLLEAVATTPRQHVLDVGCGTGSTTVAIAKHAERCTGVDISEPMIAAARERAVREKSSAEFVVADAQTHAFESAGFDTIVSRFGVMFFNDPIAAFANLRRAARPDATLRLVAWRSADENPFMTTAERAAAPLLPQLPARNPNEPGQFAFGDAARVRGILEKSGWSAVDLQRIDLPCTMPESALEKYLSHLGPVGRVLQQADEALRERVLATVRPAFDPYVHGTEVRFNAACWLIAARS